MPRVKFWSSRSQVPCWPKRKWHGMLLDCQLRSPPRCPKSIIWLEALAPKVLPPSLLGKLPVL
jgi:hypothetical protein